jgi:hypothetical protein
MESIDVPREWFSPEAAMTQEDPMMDLGISIWHPIWNKVIIHVRESAVCTLDDPVRDRVGSSMLVPVQSAVHSVRQSPMDFVFVQGES